jgi:hypothetical protein
LGYSIQAFFGTVHEEVPAAVEQSSVAPLA